MSNERANAAHAAKEQHGAASSSPHVGVFASCCTIRRGSYKCSAVKGKRCTRAKERRGAVFSSPYVGRLSTLSILVHIGGGRIDGGGVVHVVHIRGAAV